MKKILFNRIHFLVLSCLVLVALQLSSCKDEGLDGPVITAVRNYAPAPDDTLVNVMVPGQFVVIEGSNLQEASLITFDGVPATFNKALFADNYAVVRVPDVISFPLVAEEDMNKIRYVTPAGETTFNFTIVPGPPSIAGISNENPTPGTPVFILGTNLFEIQSLTFSGTLITDYQLTSTGTMISFMAPEFSESAPLIIKTISGADSTAYNVNDITTGALSNFDNVFNWVWWAADLKSGNPNSSWPSYSPDFHGNQSNFLVINSGVMNSGDGSQWGNAIRIDNIRWLPEESLSTPVNNWALKFEMNVPSLWNGGSMCILRANEADLMARFEPWTSGAFSTNGWQTITIPLSMFADGDGKGTPISSLSQLLGDTGVRDFRLYFHNYASSPTATGFYGAFDNFRVVKIR
jgi:hypothetical protein